MLRLRLVLTFLLISGLISTPAAATIMIRLNLDTLVGRADRVVVGEVISKHSAFNKRGRIYTEATLRVERTVRGPTTPTITVRTAGGVVGHIGMRIIGAPRLSVGERVLVFTERRGTGRYVVGMRQGLFRVAQNSAGQAIVRRSIEGISFAKIGTHHVVPPRTTMKHLDGVIPLDHFITDIQKTAARCAQREDHCIPKTLHP